MILIVITTFQRVSSNNNSNNKNSNSNKNRIIVIVILIVLKVVITFQRKSKMSDRTAVYSSILLPVGLSDRT